MLSMRCHALQTTQQRIHTLGEAWQRQLTHTIAITRIHSRLHPGTLAPRRPRTLVPITNKCTLHLSTAAGTLVEASASAARIGSHVSECEARAYFVGVIVRIIRRFGDLYF